MRYFKTVKDSKNEELEKIKKEAFKGQEEAIKERGLVTLAPEYAKLLNLFPGVYEWVTNELPNETHIYGPLLLDAFDTKGERIGNYVAVYRLRQ